MVVAPFSVSQSGASRIVVGGCGEGNLGLTEVLEAVYAS